MSRSGPLLGMLAASIVLFATLAGEVASGAPIVDLDRAVAVWLHANPTPLATGVLTPVTELGASAVLLAVTIAAVLALSLRRRVAHAALVMAALAGGQALNLVLKAAFERPRPRLSDPLDTAAGFSFPSGHAMIACAVYGALVMTIAARLSSQAMRAGVLALGLALVGAIGFSRVYLGVHYLSDVLAGYCAGLAWLAFCALLLLHPSQPRW